MSMGAMATRTDALPLSPALNASYADRGVRFLL
jgi:hypothetical protein